MSKYLPLDYYDIHLDREAAITIDTMEDRSIIIFTLKGDAYIGGELVREKTAVKLTEGNKVVLRATDIACQILFISSNKLEEEVYWGGPIVMNTREELDKAFDDLRKGTFLKEEISY